MGSTDPDPSENDKNDKSNKRDNITLLEEHVEGSLNDEPSILHPAVSFFRTLPNALNTRRRYSAFRPIPFPNRGDLIQQKDEYSEMDTEVEIVLDEKDNIVRKNVMKVAEENEELSEESSLGNKKEQKGASDLEIFLKEFHAHTAEKTLKSVEPVNSEAAVNIKELSWWFFGFVILLGLLVFSQFILSILCFTVVGDPRETHHSNNLYNKSTTTPKTPKTFVLDTG